MTPALSRRLAAEAAGVCLLVATVVGSGIMAETLTADRAVALLGNTLPTGAMLVVLIATLRPVSGAHLNPAVTLVAAVRREMRPIEAAAYAGAQIVGGLGGCALANLMFALAPIAPATVARTGVGQWLAEAVATFGLVATILASLRRGGADVAWLVGLYIGAAYWFTSSTSFANPAVTLARSLTDTFSGIRPQDVPAFVVAQLAGALAAHSAVAWLFGPEKPRSLTSGGPA